MKQNASAVVAKAAAGEVVVVTDRGRPVVQMGPIPSSRIEALVAAGRARRARRRLGDLPVPKRRKPGEPALSEELARMRQAERD